MLFGGKEVTRVYKRIVLLKHKLTRSKEDSMGLEGGSLFGPNSVSANTTQKERDQSTCNSRQDKTLPTRFKHL